MDRGKTVGIDLRDSQPAHRQPAREADLRDLDLGDEIARIGLPDLIVPTKSPKRVIVDLAVLNRMYLSSLQGQIMREVRLIDRDLHFDRDRATRVGGLLDEYSKAIINWELMEKYSTSSKGEFERDPYMITSSFKLQRDMIEVAGLIDELPSSRRDRPTYPSLDEKKPQLPIGSRPAARARRDLEAFVRRFSFALFGALSLLAPMVLMVLTGGILATLLTVCIAVLLFAFVVSLWGEDESPATILAIVASYTAVLVVFVGTSGSAVS